MPWGVVGAAAQARAPIRIGYLTQEYSYSRAIREQVSSAGMDGQIDTEIPLPGLPESRSQLAVPMISGGLLLGVLFVESPRDLAFDYEDEDALAVAAALTAAQIRTLEEDAMSEDSPGDKKQPTQGRVSVPAGEPVTIRFYPENGSVFLDDRYLIKGFLQVSVKPCTAHSVPFFLSRPSCRFSTSRRSSRPPQL